MSKEAKHTPGPWHLAIHSIISHNPAKTIIEIGAHRDEEREANARLIAAAPELLAALKDAEKWMLESLSINHGHCGMITATKNAQAAIAKATQQEP